MMQVEIRGPFVDRIHDDQPSTCSAHGIQSDAQGIGEERSSEPTTVQRLFEREARQKYSRDHFGCTTSDLARRVTPAKDMRGESEVCDDATTLVEPEIRSRGTAEVGMKGVVAQPHIE